MSDTTPMTLTHSRAFVDRAFAETGAFQWARETAFNAIEAGATRIEFGIDWNGVAATGTYRRTIIDNGCGMDDEELVTFFRALGATSKQIGGAHENYGIGAKVSLLPWNTAGVVIVSWKDGEGNVIWAKADADTGEYGLRQVDVDGEIVDVWPSETDDPELGFDIEALRPDWIGENGTVVLLLGDSLTQDTMLNDPRRDKSGNRALYDYLSRRLWRIPGSLEIWAHELTGQRSAWPKTPPTDRGFRRRVVGAERSMPRHIAHSGVIDLTDKTRIHWALGDPKRNNEYADSLGYIAALYRNELYEHKTKGSDYRNFGIGHAVVRKQLWLIVEPPESDPDRQRGVFPESDRNALLWNSGTGENTPLPWAEWGDEWTRRMPAEVRDVIAAQARGGEITDEAYLERLANLYGDRFQMQRRVVAEAGDDTVEPTESRRTRRSKRKGRGDGSLDSDQHNVGEVDGTLAARRIKPRAALPTWKPGTEEDIDAKGMMAAFQPGHPGVVHVNLDHPVIVGQVDHWLKHYPHDPETVRDLIHGVYGECAVAAVGHSESLKSLGVDMRTIRDQVRSPQALTMAMLGLMPHDQLISRRLKNKLGRRRDDEAGATA